MTDQKQTGRCWIFAALNVMRLGIIEKYGLAEDFELVRDGKQSLRGLNPSIMSTARAKIQALRLLEQSPSLRHQ